MLLKLSNEDMNLELVATSFVYEHLPTDTFYGVHIRIDLAISNNLENILDMLGAAENKVFTSIQLFNSDNELIYNITRNATLYEIHDACMDNEQRVVNVVLKL